jgi:hypothetical protein
VTVGEINLWLEKRKTKAVELMGILGMEHLSKRVEMVKLKSHKEELMAKLGQVKLVLDFMQSTGVTTKNKLELILAIEDHVDLDEVNLQKMTCEFYRSTMHKTKVDYKDLMNYIMFINIS